MAQHLQIRKVVRDPLLFQRRNEGVVRIQIGDDLKTTLKRDNLPLEVPLQYTIISDRKLKNSPLQSDSDFLIKDFEDFLRRATSEEITMHFETCDSRLATLRRTKLKGSVFVWIIFPGASPHLYYMFNR